MKHAVLTIGGSDAWAGGGIQTDLKTFEQHGVFGVTALTCIATADDTEEFVIYPLDSQLLALQLHTIQESYHLSAIKIGLISTVEMVEIVRTFIKGQDCPIVIDPVLAFKETDKRYNPEYVAAIRDLCKVADVVTPNLIEAMMLANNHEPIEQVEVAQLAQQLCHILQTNVIVKGGNRVQGEEAYDVLATDQGIQHYTAPKLNCTTVHGAGCSFASAIAANLAQKVSLNDAIQQSKQFVYQSIAYGFELTQESGNVWYAKGGNE